MRRTLAIVKKDLKDTFRSRSLYVSLGIAAFIFVMWSGDLAKMVEALADEGIPIPRAVSTLQPMVNSLTLLLSFSLTIFFGMYINSYAIIMEKAKRSLESLLCTPVSLHRIWLGKAVAIFLPSTVMGLGITFLGLLGLDAAVIAPKLGAHVVSTGAPLAAALVGVPAVVFPIVLVLVGAQLLLGNVRWVNIIFLALIFTSGYGFSRSLSLGPDSWTIVGVLLGIAAVLLLLAIALARFLTPERVILSSKG